MDNAEFDQFADEYNAVLARNIALSGERPAYFAEDKVIALAHAWRNLRGAAATPPAMLDFGAGIGTSVPYVHAHLPGTALTCVDVSSRCLELGRARCGTLAQFIQFDGTTLPFADASFDIAYAACVFHHIDKNEHAQLLGELRRVLLPGGMLVVFEHNPYNPLTVRTVRDCVFDDNAVLIAARTLRARVRAAGFAAVTIHYRIFFPRALRALRPLERYLTWLPLGAQYYALAVQ